MSSTATIPFAARAATPPRLASTSVAGVRWDEDRQINLAGDGQPWHMKEQAASSTDTNQDGQGDDVSDPYFAPAS